MIIYVPGYCQDGAEKIVFAVPQHVPAKIKSEIKTTLSVLDAREKPMSMSQNLLIWSFLCKFV